MNAKMTKISQATRKKRAIRFSVLTASGLAVIKIVVAIFSGSLSILASALDSLFDLLISTINLWAVRKSDADPTKSFRYGFGKIEGIIGLFQGIIITFSGGALAFFSIKRAMGEGMISHLPEGIAVMTFSTIITIWLVKFLKKEAKTTNSLLLESDAAHYQSDVFANLAILISILFIFFTGKVWIDGFVSVIMAFLIIKSGISIFKKAVFLLLDHEVSPEIKKKIIKILKTAIKNNKITSYHYLRTRQSGSKIFVDVHMVFTPKTLLIEAHNTSDKIQEQIEKVIEEGDVLIHLDPVDDSKEGK